MNKVNLLMDVGTTNLRVTLLDEKMSAVDCVKASGGVRHTAIDGHNGRLKSLLKESIQEVLSGNGLAHGDVSKCVAYGMISSNMGLVEIPHFPAPADKDCLRSAVEMRSFPEIAPFPIAFIPGVKSFSEKVTLENFSQMDMMRGEETEAIGLYSLLQPEGNSIFVLPGSHNKFVYMNEKGAIAGSVTSVSGELLDAITNHTILADSAGRAFADESEYQREAVLAGANECAQGGIGKAVFAGRILNTLGKKDTSFIRSYLLGAALAEDAKALNAFIERMGSAKIYIAGKSVIKRALYDIIKALTDMDTETVNQSISERMGIAGARDIAF